MRDYPSTETKEDCKIRLYKGAPWQDAFIQRAASAYQKPIEGFKNMDKQEKLAALKALMKEQVIKAESKGSEMIVGTVDDLPIEFKTILQQSTGYPLLDKFTNGGFPSGGQTTISGAPGVGKTSLALMLAGSYQKQGKVVLFLNFESIMDQYWAQSLGVDTSELMLVEGKALEDGLIAVEDAVNAGIIDLVIVDSLDAATPRGEYHKKGSKGKPGIARDLDDDTMALKARVMSQFYRRVSFPFRKHNTSLIMIGQHRTALGGYVAYEKMGGGLARQYADVLYLKLSKTKEIIEQEKEQLAYQLKIKVEKSKYSGVATGQELLTFFFKDCGFNPEFEYVAMSLSGNIINSPLISKGASTRYTDSKGIEHTIRGSKPNTIYTKMLEEGYMSDFIMQLKELENEQIYIEQDQDMANGVSEST
jgi:recombination protein RecA